MKNHIWRIFWRLIVIDNWYVIWVNSDRMCLCKCNCWVEKYIRLSSMRCWKINSCWCIKSEIMREKQTIHWMNNTRIWRIRRWIKTRCNNKNTKIYKHYWWRWISYDPKRETFIGFYDDMWQTYKEWLELDRIDNSWNYSKKNCKRTTHLENMSHTRKNHMITFNWETMDIRRWSKKIWKHESTILRRIKSWQSLDVILSPRKRAY